MLKHGNDAMERTEGDDYTHTKDKIMMHTSKEG